MKLNRPCWLYRHMSITHEHRVLLNISNLLIAVNFSAVLCWYMCVNPFNSRLNSSLCLSVETQIWDPLENHWSHKWKQLHLHWPDTTAIQWQMGVSSRQTKARFVLILHWCFTRSHMTDFWIMDIMKIHLTPLTWTNWLCFEIDWLIDWLI